MNQNVDPDDELLVRLRSIASTVDPVPEDVVLAGRSAIAHRDLDARLAVLVEEELASSVRGDGESWFTFEVDDVLIEVAVREHRDGRRLVGQVDGVPVESLHVGQPEQQTRIDVDEVGRFSGTVAPGPLRLEVVLDSGSRIVTSWLLAP